MAVPKKRTSHSKKNSRAATWIRKANKQAQLAFTLANSVLSSKPSSFVYNLESSSETKN
jgi:large subunit ribosomal protein L32